MKVELGVGDPKIVIEPWPFLDTGMVGLEVYTHDGKHLSLNLALEQAEQLAQAVTAAVMQVRQYNAAMDAFFNEQEGSRI